MASVFLQVFPDGIHTLHQISHMALQMEQMGTLIIFANYACGWTHGIDFLLNE
jgi:hypothetical protein